MIYNAINTILLTNTLNLSDVSSHIMFFLLLLLHTISQFQIMAEKKEEKDACLLKSSTTPSHFLRERTNFSREKSAKVYHFTWIVYYLTRRLGHYPTLSYTGVGL